MLACVYSVELRIGNLAWSNVARGSVYRRVLVDKAVRHMAEGGKIIAVDAEGGVIVVDAEGRLLPSHFRSSPQKSKVQMTQ